MTGRTLCRMLLVDTWIICTFMCLSESQPMLFVLLIYTVRWKRMRFILDFLVSGNINRLKNQSSTTKDSCLQTREKPRDPPNNNNWLSEVRGCFLGKEDALKNFERVCDELEAYNGTAGGYSSIMKLQGRQTMNKVEDIMAMSRSRLLNRLLARTELLMARQMV